MNKFLALWHAEKLNPLADILARWLLLLGMVDARKNKVYDEIYKELEELAMKDEHLLEAFDVWQELSQSPEERMAYISRLKYILDEEAKYDHARDEGGNQKVLEFITTLLEDGLNVEKIAKYTRLSVEEVQKIIKNNQLEQQDER